MLDLIKVEEQTYYCREIYEDKNTNKLYCRHVNDRYSKGIYVNHWDTFNGEPDCPLKNGIEIRMGNQAFIIERDEYTGWAIEREQLRVRYSLFVFQKNVSIVAASDMGTIDLTSIIHNGKE